MSAGLPGFSLPELLLALKKCKDIYDAFYDPYKKQSRRLQDFGDELDRHYKALDISADIVDWTGEQYEGLRHYYETLEECHKLLLSQRRVFKDGRLADSIIGISQTVWSAFEDGIKTLQIKLDRRFGLSWVSPWTFV